MDLGTDYYYYYSNYYYYYYYHYYCYLQQVDALLVQLQLLFIAG